MLMFRLRHIQHDLKRPCGGLTGAVLALLIAFAPLTNLLHQDAAAPLDTCRHAAHAAEHADGSISLHAPGCAHLPTDEHHDGATCPACRSLAQGRTSLVVRTVIGPPTETARSLIGDDSGPRALSASRSSTAPRAPPLPV
jgi:hypothetical protein